MSRPSDARAESFKPPIPWRSSLLVRQARFVGTVVVLTGLVMTFAAYRVVRVSLREAIHERLEVQAADEQSMIEVYVAQQQERIALLASRTRLRQLLDEQAGGETTGDDFLESSRRIIEDARLSTIPDGDARSAGAAAGGAFHVIAIADARGRVVTATDASWVGRDVSNEAAFREGLNGFYLGAPRRAAEGYEATLAGPAVTPMDRRFVVIVRLDAGQLVAALGDPTGHGETGEVLLVVRRDGEVELLAPPRHPVPGSIGAEAAVASALAARGETALGQMRDYRGIPVVAAVRPAGYRDWGLVVKRDVEEAYAPLRRLRNVLFGLAAIVLLAGTAASYALARKMTRPVHALAQTARRVEAGDLSARAKVESDDEVGMLAEAFNGMAEQVAASHADLERRVAERTAELERSNADLERFAYVASHDLKEPLRSVAGFCQLLARRYKGKIDSNADDYIEHAVEGARRMQKLLDDLLEYSRVGRSKQTLEEFDCEEVIDQVKTSLEAAIAESGAEVTYEPLPRLLADRSQMTQLFQNLIGNSIKYRGEAAPRVDVTAEAENGAWKFTVHDNGIGIAPEHSEQIFVVFQRLHTRDQYGGTGIGLAVCKRIVERHHGRIWVEPAPGGGSLFRFTIARVPS